MKNLKKNFLVYTISNFANSSVPFILLPILTNDFSPSEYGTLSIYQAFILFLTPFILLNYQTAVSVKYFQTEREIFRQYLSSSLLVPILGLLIIQILIFIFAASLHELFQIPLLYIHLLPFFTFSQSIVKLILVVFRITEESINYGIYQFALTLFNLLLSLYFVIGLGFSWEGRIFGIVFSNIIFSFLGFYILLKKKLILKSINRSYIKDNILFGAPLVLHIVGTAVMTISDRLFISKMINNSALGIYTVAYQIGTILMLVISSMDLAWGPQAYKLMKTNRISSFRKLFKYQSFMYFGIIVCFLFIYLSIPVVYNFFIDHNYHDGIDYVFWIMIGYVFQGFYALNSKIFTFRRKTFLLSRITFSAALLNIVFNYFFIKRFGVIGAAYSTALSWFLFFMISMLISIRLYPFPVSQVIQGIFRNEIKGN